MALPPIHRKYLGSLGMLKPLIDKAANAYDFYRGMITGPIPGFFVGEYITGEGRREYESLWLFTPRLVMEAKRFIIEDDFDFTPLRMKVIYFRLQMTNYDFEKAVSTSRLSVRARDQNDIVYELRASGMNCDRLRDVSKRFLFGNLRMQ